MNENDIIPIIPRYLRREATELEKQLLLRWLEESEENRRFFADLAANFTIHESLTSEELLSGQERMAQRLSARMDEERERSGAQGRFLRRLGLVLGAAAALVAAVFLFRHSVAEPAVPYLTFSNTGADIRPVLLEDGTRVWLKPGGEIRYNVSGLTDRRLVALRGQAYFDVARDESRPMTVSTEHLGVRVLGTAFAVSSGTNMTQVVLERGSVRILSPEGRGMVNLSPGQKATYLSKTDDMTVDAVYAEAYVTQHYNLISLSDVTLPEILERLEQRFGVVIRSASSDNTKRYTVNYLKTDSLEDILSIVEYLTGSSCEVIH